MRPYFNSLPKPSTVVIKNAAYVITEQGPQRNRSIFIENRKISGIGDLAEIRSKHGHAEHEIDASRCLVIPGLVNNHSHIAMSLLRGYAEDLPLLSWLKDKVWPAEAKLKPDDICLGATAGATEALLSGITSITSVYFYDQTGSEAEAARDIGMRGIFAHGVFDWSKEAALKKTGEMVDAFHGVDEGRIRVATSPHAPYTCSPELLKGIEELRGRLNQKYGKNFRVMNTLHVAEMRNEASEIESKYKVNVNKGIASYLKSIGVLNEDTIMAHCIHMTEEDIAAVKSTRASIASCPISNLKVGMGVANLPKALTNGITVSLGTDGPASNNALDMFETMKIASLLPKGIQGDPTLMNARQTFECATIGGARSMRQQHQIGSIAVGKHADIAVLGLSSLRSFPFYDAYSHLVFAAKSEDVRDVLVDGRILVSDRNILSVDTPKLEDEINKRVVSLGFKTS